MAASKGEPVTKGYVAQSTFKSVKGEHGGKPQMVGPDGRAFLLPDDCERFTGEEGDSKAVIVRAKDSQDSTLERDDAYAPPPPPPIPDVAPARVP